MKNNALMFGGLDKPKHYKRNAGTHRIATYLRQEENRIS